MVPGFVATFKTIRWTFCYSICFISCRLPPLLVQAIGKAKECPPKKPAPGTKEAVPVPPPTPPPASRKSSASWRGGKARVTSGSKPPVKPVQRVVVHSSVL